MSDPALERIRVYFDERLLAYNTGSGFFEHPPHPLLSVNECALAPIARSAAHLA